MFQSLLSIYNFSAETRREVVILARWLLLAVLLPTVLLTAVIEAAAWSIGATMTPRQLAFAQQENPDLLVAGDPRYYAYKAARATFLKPDVVFIGHSRCGQVRAEMFKPYIMYNACHSAWTIDHLRQMIDLLTKTSSPKIIMFTLDYFMFTDAYESAFAKNADFKSLGFSFETHVNGIAKLATGFKDNPKRMIMAWLHGVRETTDGLTLLGPDAIKAATGFRYDGSFLYDPGTRTGAPIRNKDRAAGLLSAVNGAPAMAPSQIMALRRLAELGRERNVTLVGIQLPYLKIALDVLDFDKDYRPYAGVWREYESKKNRDLIRSMGIHFFDLSRDPVSLDQRYFVDPAHPAEAGVLAAFVRLLDNKEFRHVFPRLDVEALRQENAAARAQGKFFDVYPGKPD